MRVYIISRGLDALFLFFKIKQEVGEIAETKKMTKKIKEEIRLRFIVGGEELKDLARVYGVSYGYLRGISCTEKWASWLGESENEELKKEYNKALISQSFEMIEVYDKILRRAKRILRTTNNSKELLNLVNVVKTVEQRKFVLMLLREEKDNG